MADNEIQKRTGTIFIGSRETSPEKLHAMQEPLRREQIRREQADDYISRVRKKAEDRAREILGAAYMEKQNVLEEAKKESLELKKRAIEEAERLRGEGEQARREGRDELDKAAAIREEAENIRANAHDEGYQAGMEQAKAELEELRSEMGQSLALVLNALGRQRKEIMEAWSGDIAEVVRCAVRAGTGMILREDREEALRALVFRSLDALERQEIVNLRVNPEDEEAVGQMFQAAREKYPSLKQWVVSPDGSVERGGLIAESGSGRVDLRRANFEEMVDNVLNHLYLPEDETKNQSEIRDLVEMEVAKIAGLTPESEPVASPETEAVDTAATEENVEVADALGQEGILETDADGTTVEATFAGEEESVSNPEDDGRPDGAEVLSELEMEALEDELEPSAEIDGEPAPVSARPAPEPGQPSYEELDEEFFPLDEPDAETPPTPAPEIPETIGSSKPTKPIAPPKNTEPPDPAALAEGGFL